MPVATRTFRVFVSSTFEDLEAERNALQATVFPALRKLCEQHSARFQAIDLRWGVRDEAALDQKTVEICLREIERCQQTRIKPNFIVLLGKRYGWRPLPARIVAREFEAVCAHIADKDERALVEGWYERDDNAVPAEFVFKPRTGEWVDAAAWEKLEARLHGILLNGARAAGLAEPDLFKYWASATHQEIVKGLGTTEADRKHLFAFCRDIPDEECDAELAHLRQFLRDRLPQKNLIDFEPDDLDGLCKTVQEKLSAVIEGEAKGFESKPALALEIEAHDRFARERSVVFGRERILEDINIYIRGGGNRPLVLDGPSGCGKSAIMARASEDTSEALPSAFVVRRFIGASPESSNGLTLLRSLCEQIGAEFGAAGEVPIEFNALVRLFAERLALATPERPLILFLDALDQLGKDDPARSLYWLAAKLPPHSRVVVSTTELAPALRECELREIEPLHEADAGKALDHWLVAAKRTLTDAQRENLLAAFNRCGLPLYLKLAFEEARLWRSSLPLAGCKLGEGEDSVAAIIDTLLNRLSQNANHGELLVSRSLGYLAAARYGLTEDEMLDVLSEDKEVWDDFLRRAHHTPPEHRLPVIVWSRVFLDLESYLGERATPGAMVLCYYHLEVSRVVSERYLRDPDKFRLSHSHLTTYFQGQADPEKNQSWKGASPRPFLVLPFHLARANRRTELIAALENLSFLEAKTAHMLILDLENDFSETLALLPPRHSEYRVLSLVEDALRRNIHFIAIHASDYPQCFFQCLWNSCWWYDCPERNAHCVPPEQSDLDDYELNGTDSPSLYRLLEKWRSDKRLTPSTVSWVRSLRPPYSRLGGPQERVMRGHSGPVNCLCLATSAKLLVSGSGDNTVRVWDALTGQEANCLHGHTESVNSVAISDDGMRILSGSNDKTMRFWDGLTGYLLHIWEHADSVRAVAMSSDGSLLACTTFNETYVWDASTGKRLCTLAPEPGQSFYGMALSWDNKMIITQSASFIQLWNISLGKEWKRLHTPHGLIGAFAVSSDYHFLVTGGQGWISDANWDGQYVEDSALRLWDLTTSKELWSYDAHGGDVTGISFSADRSLVIYSSKDGAIRLIDTISGRHLSRLDGHEGGINTVSLGLSASSVISGGDDHSIRVWDYEKRNKFSRLKGPRSAIICLSYDDRNRRVIAGVEDGEIYIWDATSGMEALHFSAHSERVNSVSITSDGMMLASCSDDKNIRLWDAYTGQLIQTMEGHHNYVHSAVISPDGRFIASGERDEPRVFIWSVKDGCQIGKLSGHKDEILEIKYSKDGRRIASRDLTDTVIVWDTEGWRRIETLEGKHDLQAVADKRQPIAESYGIGVCLHRVGAEFPRVYFEEAMYEVERSEDGGTFCGRIGKHLFIVRVEEYASQAVNRIDAAN